MHHAGHAGAGRMGDGTQYTVNNQMVNATLMNIADAPTNVQLPGVYKTEEVQFMALFYNYHCALGMGLADPVIVAPCDGIAPFCRQIC
jgi:hypothetical protein